MNYILSEQYARGEEILIAEFINEIDAHLFIVKKISNDAIQHNELIYRLYVDNVLVNKFNQDSISVAYAQYEEGNSDFINAKPFTFNVMMQRTNTLEKTSTAHFNNHDDAILFVHEKCNADRTIKESDLFYILNGQTLIQTLNKIIINHQKLETDGSQGNQSGATFHPTPTPMRPTPPGGPSDCWIESDEDEADKK